MIRNYSGVHRSSHLSVLLPKHHSVALRRVSQSSRSALKPLLVPISKPATNGVNCNEIINDIDDLGSSRMGLHKAGKSTHDLLLPSLPPIPKTTDPQFKNIFMEKIKLCTQICDFSNPSNDLKAKEIKGKTLSEILTAFLSIGFNTNCDDEIKNALFEMVKTNLLKRKITFNISHFFNADSSCYLVEDWDHIELIYKILLNMIKAFPRNSGWNQNFIRQILPLMSSKDTNERDSMTQFLTAYILNTPQEIQFLYPIISQKLIDHRESSDPCGVYTCLSVMQSIYTNVSCLQKIFRAIFLTHIVPLIGDKFLQIFHVPLFQIISINIAESPQRVIPVLLTIINFWPISHAAKQEILLRAMVKTLAYMEKIDEKILTKALSIIAHCCDSEYFKVAELANRSLIDQVILDLIGYDTKSYIPMILPHVELAQSHWSNNVREAADAAMRAISRLDPRFVADRKATFSLDQQKSKLSSWATIARKAAHRDRSLNLANKLGELTKVFNANTGSATSPPSSIHAVQSSAAISQTEKYIQAKIIKPRVYI